MVYPRKMSVSSLMSSGSPGFSLIEILVVISIMGIIAAITVQTYPTVRGKQQLARAEQQLQSMLRRGAQQAVNEERHDNCLVDMRAASQPEKLCSDIGLAIDNNSMTLFADTNNPDVNRYEPGSDFLITQEQLPAPGIVETPTTFVFEAVPPILKLFVDGAEYTAPVPLSLRVGDTSQQFLVHAYGQLIAQ